MDPTLIAIVIPIVLIAAIIALAMQGRRGGADRSRSARGNVPDSGSGADSGIALWSSADSTSGSPSGDSGGDYFSGGGGDSGGGGAEGGWDGGSGGGDPGGGDSGGGDSGGGDGGGGGD